MSRVFHRVTFDLELHEVTGVLQALLHLAAVVSRVAGAQISQPKWRIIREGGVVEQRRSVSVRFIDLHLVTLYH